MSNDRTCKWSSSSSVEWRIWPWQFSICWKQVIIVGEFLQLRPVPNSLDSGEFMLKSRVFEHAIAHRFELTKVLRQSEADKMFVAALKDLRLGKCSEETSNCMAQLSRALENEMGTHIFFKRNGALLFVNSLQQVQSPRNSGRARTIVNWSLHPWSLLDVESSHRPNKTSLNKTSSTRSGSNLTLGPGL